MRGQIRKNRRYMEAKKKRIHNTQVTRMSRIARVKNMTMVDILSSISIIRSAHLLRFDEVLVAYKRNEVLIRTSYWISILVNTARHILPMEISKLSKNWDFIYTFHTFYSNRNLPTTWVCRYGDKLMTQSGRNKTCSVQRTSHDVPGIGHEQKI